jgi:hypothetical protein
MRTVIQGKTGLKTVDLNRRKAIREKCLNCSCWDFKEVANCKFIDCALHRYRKGNGKQDSKDRDRAIKGYCFWCVAGQRSEIAKCVSVHCPLFGFRKDRVEKSNPLPKKAHGEVQIEANSPGRP